MYSAVGPKLSHWLLSRQLRRIYLTHPVTVQRGPATIVSTVAQHSVAMYLIAIKSFCARLHGLDGAIVAFVDDAMPEQRKTMLREHVRGIELISSSSAHSTRWRRRGGSPHPTRQGEFVIELKPETICLGDIDEIRACIVGNIPFVMAGPCSAQTLSNSGAVGLELTTLIDSGQLEYVRASAGLAGFPRMGHCQVERHAVHRRRIVGLLKGETWRRSGEGECGLSFAATKESCWAVLPWTDYVSLAPKVAISHHPKLLHFSDPFGSQARQYERFATAFIHSRIDLETPPLWQAGEFQVPWRKC